MNMISKLRYVVYLLTFKQVFREPDFIVEGPNGIEDPYLLRWYLVPRNKYFNIYLHKFLRSDEDRALHDHPWASLGILLTGRYKEHLPKDQVKWINEGDRETIIKVRYPGIPIYRGSDCIHRIELFNRPDGTEQHVWTLFMTGSKVREWGFWCEKGFRMWKEFVSHTEKSNGVGKGCAD